MKLCNVGHNFDYEMEKLVRIFLPFEKIEIEKSILEQENVIICQLYKQDDCTKALAKVNLFGKTKQSEAVVKCGLLDFEKECQHTLARELYNCLASQLDYQSDWGILTGVRPARLFSANCERFGLDTAKEQFKERFLVSEQKISLCEETTKSEQAIVSLSKPKTFSLYVSIPFCPTRCSYCSFVSHSVDKAQDIIPQYIEKLAEELKITGEIARELGLELATVYVGGGTPTALDAEQLEYVLGAVAENFDLSGVLEYTVEAGRPDTITEQKLNVIKASGATRISINPQTMNDSVLSAIGRRHSAKEMLSAFKLAREAGFDNINCDLIAGLPSDDYESFCDTVEKILELDPESITIHALSMKRASNLTRKGELPEIEMGRQAQKMVSFARQELTSRSIFPYYMYRQSKTVGNLENVGYAKHGYEGLYNVYIMDETHTILACGASAVTKMRSYYTGDIQRIFNYKYPYEYISDFDTIISRKEGIKEFYDKYYK